MELSDLPSKQKRLKDWTEFTEHEVRDNALRSDIMNTLGRFRTALIRCWENGRLSESDSAEISSLERELERLNEEARLRVSTR